MARQVYIPGAAAANTTKADTLSKLLTLGGAAAGGFASGGSPQGIMMGAQAGGMASGMLSKAPAQTQEVAPLQGTAMDRRMNQLQNSDLSNLRNSIDSLQYVKDDSMREQLAKPLLQAEFMAKRKMGA